MSDITVALLVIFILAGVLVFAMFAVGGASKETSRVRGKHTETPDTDYGDEDYVSDD